MPPFKSDGRGARRRCAGNHPAGAPCRHLPLYASTFASCCRPPARAGNARCHRLLLRRALVRPGSPRRPRSRRRRVLQQYLSLVSFIPTAGARRRATATRCGRRPQFWPASFRPFPRLLPAPPADLDRTDSSPASCRSSGWAPSLDRVGWCRARELAWLVNLAVLVRALASVGGGGICRCSPRGTFRGHQGRRFAAVLCYFAGLGVGFPRIF